MDACRRLPALSVPLFILSIYCTAWVRRHKPGGMTTFPGSFVAHVANPSWALQTQATSRWAGTRGVFTSGRRNTKCYSRYAGGMELLHEDDAVIVVNKPAGVPVYPTSPVPASLGQRPNTDSVVDRLIAYYTPPKEPNQLPETMVGTCAPPEGKGFFKRSFGDLSEGPENPMTEAVVHRLDKGTSGVLLLAKSATAASCLRQQFRERKVRKTYFAVIRGGLTGPMTVTSCIGRLHSDRRRMQSARQIWSVHASATHAVAGKLRGAVTLFKPLIFNGKWSVVLASPVTGRTHQIRLHLQMLKTPIIGDPLYGDASTTSAFFASSTARKPGSRSVFCSAHRIADAHQRSLNKGFCGDSHRPLLHAAELCCVHPTTKDTLRVCAPLPPDMRQAMDIVDPLWPTVPEITPFAEGPQ